MKRTYHNWTKREVELVRNLYPIGGTRACCLQLPYLSKTAIHARARLLGLRRIFGKAAA